MENAIHDLNYAVGLFPLPSGLFPGNGAWLDVQVMAHKVVCWAGRIGMGEQVVTTKTLRRDFFALNGRPTRKERRLILHLAQYWPWEAKFARALA